MTLPMTSIIKIAKVKVSCKTDEQRELVDKWVEGMFKDMDILAVWETKGLIESAINTILQYSDKTEENLC